MEKKEISLSNNGEEKVDLENFNFKWFWNQNKKTILIASAIIASGLTIVGLAKGCSDSKDPKPIEPSGSDDSRDILVDSDVSYEYGDYVYIIIKSDGRYDEGILNNAIKEKKKIGIIIEPNSNKDFVNKTIANIFDIMSRCNVVDLPVLYDVGILRDEQSKNCEIVNKLFNEFKKYNLYVGFYGNFANMSDFIYSYGNDASNYDKMLCDIDDLEFYNEIYDNVKGNMIRYSDGRIEISQSVIDAISNYKLNCFGDNHKGIDISSWQGNINGSELKENGTEFVIIKICDCYTVTYNENYSLDSKIYRNIQECIDNDIPFGLYYYTRARNINDARLEATFIKRNLIDLEDSLDGKKIPIFVDIEADTEFEPQQNIYNLFSKIDETYDFSSGYIDVDDEMSIVMQASTIIDSIYNYFYQYKKGTLNIEQIMNVDNLINEYLNNNSLYCYDEEGNKIEINDYILRSSHNYEEKLELEDNFKIEEYKGGYRILTKRYNSSTDSYEFETLIISETDIKILNLAKRVLSNHLGDEEFIDQLNSCYKPEYILRTIIDSFGDSYNIGFYSGERVLKKVSSLDSNVPLWVTSSETYNDTVDFNNWNANFYNEYSDYDIIQYCQNGYVDGVGSCSVDVDIANSSMIDSLIHSKWLNNSCSFYDEGKVMH